MISRGLMIRVGSQDDDGRPIDRRKLNELLKLPHRICSSTAAGPAALPCAASMNGEENPRRTNPLFSQTPDPNYRYVSFLGSSRAAVSACAIVHLLSTEHTLTLSHTRTLANHTHSLVCLRGGLTSDECDLITAVGEASVATGASPLICAAAAATATATLSLLPRANANSNSPLTHFLPLAYATQSSENPTSMVAAVPAAQRTTTW